MKRVKEKEEKEIRVGEIPAEELTPREIVDYLSRYVIGQDEAKKAIAIALRNRIRRMKLPEGIREEVTPKNMLMIGPTGVGKTEIARRISKLVSAPFIKVEATKYTEVGYVGKDVESIIRDLVNIAISEEKAKIRKSISNQVENIVAERIANILIKQKDLPEEDKNLIKLKVKSGKYDDEYIEITVSEPQFEFIAAPFVPGMEGIEEQLRDMLSSIGPKKQRKRRAKVSEVKRIFEEEEINKLIDNETLIRTTIEKVENKGIVFIDEIDKLITKGNSAGPDVSGEGVQRDLLPLIEGTTVATRYGPVRTDFILFIAAGAFHKVSPSDLLPELQGRLPIRVELKPLTREDFVRILKEVDSSPLKQYKYLLKTEEVDLEFTDEAIEKMAEYAYKINTMQENIGARRLYTIVEKVVEDISFDAPTLKGQKIVVDEKYVEYKILPLLKDQNLAKYIL